ncbi:MAG: hypothetical protein A7315_13350 [Candidatus Altiarchaeales archaeon WOR_SM1_79]|nr:MAG: hypothetical protein A7315_13350 [Candidatus Altiarchaeales archaeon WOR_SM1_79]
MKNITKIGIGILLTVILIGGTTAQNITELENFVGEPSVMHLTAWKAAALAMDKLDVEKGDNILVLTDAGYTSMIDGHTTEECLDALIIATGASPGKNNLFQLHRAYYQPLWFVFFDSKTKDCVYVEVDSKTLGKYLKNNDVEGFKNLDDNEIFKIMAKENIDPEKLLNNPEEWNKKVNAKVFGGNEFSITTVSSVWANDASNEFLKSAELHNHICPGLSSGYLIVKYLEKEMPIENEKQSYKIYAAPSWCKDDAIQTILDTTVGKKGMYVVGLTKEQEKQLPKGTAGIYFRCDTTTGICDGRVLTFNWNKAFKDCNMNSSWLQDWKTYKGWWTRYKMNLWMMDYTDNPGYLVGTAKEFTINASRIGGGGDFTSAGVNPYVELGLMSEENGGIKTEPEAESQPWIYALIGLLVIIAIGIAFYMKKNK